MKLDISSHILPPSESYPYAISAKKYTSTTASNDPDALTLIFTHAAGMHKECFEPVIEHLFDMLGKGSVKVMEAWAIDCIQHGEAGVLNEEILKTTLLESFQPSVYGAAVGRFLTAGESHGAKVDFTKRNLCGIGHSLGSLALITVQITQSLPIKFQSLYIIEPVFLPDGIDLIPMLKFLTYSTYIRRDVWPSREEAYKDLNTSKGLKKWDRRVLRLFVDYALRPHPSANFQLCPYPGVVLACTRMHEGACYRGAEVEGRAYIEELGPISKQIPLHLLWGAFDDSAPRSVKEFITERARSSIKFASVSFVPDAGHLVVQHSPKGVADAIFNGLNIDRTLPERSKL